MHGAVVGISWPQAGDTVEVGGPPDPTTITVALGDTMGEALGALVARANAAPAEAAIVEALQLGVIKELDEPDGRAQLDSQLHASSFTALSGGDPTTETITIAPSGPPPAPQPPHHVILPIGPVIGQPVAEMKVARGVAPVVLGATPILDQRVGEEAEEYGADY